LGIEQEREIPWQEAVVSWYDRVYLPVAAAIWASDIMEQFPHRTAADFYLWVCRHREELAAESGAVPPPVVAVAALAEDKPSEKDATARVVESVKRVLTGSKPDDLATTAAKALPSDLTAQEKK
jgi:hypothetical protein